MTVVLWGRSDEAVVEAVASACTERGLRVLIADGDEIDFVDPAGDLALAGGSRVPLRSVTGLFVRPEARPTTERSRYAFDALSAWAELTDAAVLNRLSAAATNRSKPYQIGLIARVGLSVPDTLVTTDPEDVLAFVAEHRRVIYKSVSGVRSIVARFDANDRDRLSDVSTCPTQFQQHVPGTDYRVHVVDDEVFACRIETDAVDYRYAGVTGDSLSMEPVTLPDDVAQQCVDVTKLLGLRLAGVDLRRDPFGRWWCFAVNTSPGFIWFENQTGLPIAAAIAASLTKCANAC